MTPPLVCVVDAGVAVKLHLAELLAAEAHALFALLADPTTFHVPDLFYVEFTLPDSATCERCPSSRPWRQKTTSAILSASSPPCLGHHRTLYHDILH